MACYYFFVYYYYFFVYYYYYCCCCRCNYYYNYYQISLLCISINALLIVSVSNIFADSFRRDLQTFYKKDIERAPSQYSPAFLWPRVSSFCFFLFFMCSTDASIFSTSSLPLSNFSDQNLPSVCVHYALYVHTYYFVFFMLISFMLVLLLLILCCCFLPVLLSYFFMKMLLPSKPRNL